MKIPGSHPSSVTDISQVFCVYPVNATFSLHPDSVTNPQPCFACISERSWAELRWCDDDAIVVSASVSTGEMPCNQPCPISCSWEGQRSELRSEGGSFLADIHCKQLGQTGVYSNLRGKARLGDSAAIRELGWKKLLCKEYSTPPSLLDCRSWVAVN